MPMGPGKYDKLCTLVRERAHANGAAVLIFDGADGDGFSVQAPLAIQLTLPQKLRYMADEIEKALFPEAQ